MSLVLLAGCASIVNNSNEVSGTIRSSFENFSFSPSDSSESYWINDINDKTGKYYAKNWHLVQDIHGPLLEKEAELRAQKLPVPIIYICVSGMASTKFRAEGTGHMRGWKSDITFTEILTAKQGRCEDLPTHL